MGNDNSKKSLDAPKVQMMCSKIRNQLEFYEEKKKSEIRGKEKELVKLIQAPKRVRDDELAKASSILLDVHIIKAYGILRRNCELVSDRSLHLVSCKGNIEEIRDLLPFIETIIFAAGYLKTPSMNEFVEAMQQHFKGNMEDEIRKSKIIDPEVVKCFGLFLPTNLQLNLYFLEFCKNYNLTL